MSKESTGTTASADRTDWDRVKSMTDAQIVHDEDSPATTAADWEGAVLRDGGVEIGQVRRRGPQKTPLKVPTTIRLDADVLAGLRATGKGWQTRVNDAMRAWLKRHPPRP